MTKAFKAYKAPTPEMARKDNADTAMRQAARRSAAYEDAANASIQSTMKVGNRVFRIGTPVSDVLAAATQEYVNSRPAATDPVARPPSENAVFLHNVREAMNAGKKTGKYLSELLDAFMAKSVADVALEDRDQFLKRIKEESGQ